MLKMATLTQTKYIEDLAVLKTKEYKEVKELLISNEIIGPDATIVNNAQSLAEICNALTEQQASRLIDILIAAKQPSRGRVYSTGRIRKSIELLDDIKATIDNWGF